MKIGILTYHDLNNYGAQLQAASTQTFLSRAGFDCELVDYRPLRHEVKRHMPLLRALRRADLGRFAMEWQRNRMFRGAIADMARLSRRQAFTQAGIARLCADFDVLICGSDEVWNFGNYRGYQTPYILDFPVKPGVRKIGYAATLGSYTPSADIRARMRAALSAFSAVFVRDPTTEAFVRDLGFRATRVVDPTFLVDLGPQPPSIADFGMITGGMSADQVDRAVAAIRARGLRPVSVGVLYPSHPNLFVPATPREWIGYVKHARAHVTALFHGVALSLKYDTPFAVFRTPGKEQKIDSLLQWMGVETRQLALDTPAEAIAEVLARPLPPEMSRLRDGHIAQSKAALLAALAGARSEV